LGHSTFRLTDGHQDALRAASRAGLADTPSAALRALLDMALGLDACAAGPSAESISKGTEVIMSKSEIAWPVKVAELRRLNPGMSYSEACSELGRRSATKRRAGVKPATAQKKSRDWQRDQEEREDELRAEREQLAAEAQSGQQADEAHGPEGRATTEAGA
jgi:hypothetical protein